MLKDVFKFATSHKVIFTQSNGKMVHTHKTSNNLKHRGIRLQITMPIITGPMGIFNWKHNYSTCKCVARAMFD